MPERFVSMRAYLRALYKCHLPFPFLSFPVTVEGVYLSAATAHKSNDVTAQVAADDDETRTTYVDEPAALKVEVRQTGLLSPAAAGAGDKPLPTANGPTWPVVTRPRLSRTLDLTTSRCVDASSTMTAAAAPPDVGPSTTSTPPPTEVLSASRVTALADDTVYSIQRNAQSTHTIFVYY